MTLCFLMQRELVKLFSLCHSRMEDVIPKGASVRYADSQKRTPRYLILETINIMFQQMAFTNALSKLTCLWDFIFPGL